jgi:hypothetical protein
LPVHFQRLAPNEERLEIHTLKLGWYNLQATESIDRIAKRTEDKAMYDTREKAIRDQQWILNAARREGLEEGELKAQLRKRMT